MRKTVRALEATDGDSEDYLRQIKFGDCVLVTIKKPRNLRFHRKFMGLLNAIWENQTTYRTVDALLIALKYNVGLVDFVMVRPDGETVIVPKSISFAKMDELEFGRFFLQAVVALRELLPDLRLLAEHTAEELEEIVEEYIH